ncbi:MULTISPECIES: hypothetical protein [Pseudomonas]|jgi:hypothetical protein|uniref:hypothetical protein n=1 Tax=Pseudomonas TaxID=286 RepID=UPI00036781F4|nr:MULTISPECIES: hypothetical protein [Pseudomonas]MBA1250373.1 hypothetical protein [Pseudomonas zeshuii]QEU26611.1 hypothetical protein FOB45_01995 [Pseudomonas luteola]
MDTSEIYTQPTSNVQFKFTKDCPAVAYIFCKTPGDVPVHLYDATSMTEAIEEARMRYWHVWLNNPLIKDSVKWAANRTEAVTKDDMVKAALGGQDWMFEFGFMEKIR